MLAENEIVRLLEAHHVRPTANRILIVKTLAEQAGPTSVRDLERVLLTVDKSNIFRALTLFKENGLVHQIEEGDGTAGYELCMSHSSEEDDDLHVHFYCEHCHKTICLADIPVPSVRMPEGYLAESVNYVVKGLCPECARKPHNLLSGK